MLPSESGIIIIMLLTSTKGRARSQWPRLL